MANLSYTPFLFASEDSLYRSADSWYVMWMNPDSFRIGFGTPQSNPQATRAGFVVTHWYNKQSTITFSGQSGYVLFESTPKEISNPDFFAEIAKNFTSAFNEESIKRMWDSANTNERVPLSIEQAENPRDFINKLRSIALSKMTFLDRNGFERYNSKKLLVYTKQFPQGVTLNGYFTAFDVDEKATDSWTVPYSIGFTVESGLIGSDPIQDLFDAVGKLVNSFVRIS